MGSYGCALEEGAYPTAAIACLARLAGPVDESDMPYLSRELFASKGFNANNPPTHFEAMNAGLIPLLGSTQDNIHFNENSVVPRNDLMLSEALFATGRTAPSSFSNLREDYAYRNRVNNTALKTLIKNYGAAMAGYYSNEKQGINFNPEHSAYFDNTTWRANHQITIIGWDDNFSRENFIIKPSSDGAWLARNNWGNFSGSDGGYEWISYEQILQDGAVCILKDRPQNLKLYDHDPLGWCNSYTYNQKSIYGANVFKAERIDETLYGVSFYTTISNVKVDVSVYQLGGSFSGPDPTAGTLIASKSATYPYAGFHTLEMDGNVLEEGHYFSVVVKYTNMNDVENASIGFPVETAVKGYSNYAAAYDHESYFADEDGQEWLDGTSMVNDFLGGVPYHVNACIKALTIAESSDVEYADWPERTINNIPVRVNNRLSWTQDTAGSTPAGSITLTPQEVSGGSPDVHVYLATTSRVHSTAVNIIGGDDDSEYSKGLTGPSEMAYVPIYEEGYVPDVYFYDYGVDYPSYGPFVMSKASNGEYTLNVDGLIYPDGSAGKVPGGYYKIYLENARFDNLPVFGEYLLAGTTSSAPDNSSDNSGGNGSSGSSSGGGGGGGGCNAGLFCAAVLAVVVLGRRK